MAEATVVRQNDVTVTLCIYQIISAWRQSRCVKPTYATHGPSRVRL